MATNGAVANDAKSHGRKRRSSPKMASATSPLTHHPLRSRIANSECSCIFSFTALRSRLTLLDDALRLRRRRGFDAADLVGQLALPLEQHLRGGDLVGRHADHHANAAVEDA